MLVEQPLADHFRGFATVVERDGGTTYPVICRAVAEDDEVLSLLDGAPLPQRRPLLLLAAVHFLLLSGVEHPLAAHYDTVADVRGTPYDPSGDAAAAFADFCREHRAALEGADRHPHDPDQRGRSLHRPAARPLPRRGAVRLERAAVPARPRHLGRPQPALRRLRLRLPGRRGRRGPSLQAPGDSAVTLECIARDDLEQLPELRLPVMAARVGLDLSPLDPFSDDAALWLLACQWPDNLPRFGRLRAALANVRASAQPAAARAGRHGDRPAADRRHHPRRRPARRVPLLGGGLPRRGTAAHPGRRGPRRSGRTRPVHHLYCESPFETPGLPTPPSPVPREGPDLATALVHFGPDGAPPVRLADTHPHGYWIRWWPAR